MLAIRCPKCAETPPAAQVNMTTDFAFCPGCNAAFSISEALADRPGAVDVEPMAGTWLREEVGATVLGASTRSPVAFFMIPFMCVWSGFSLGGIYGRQIASGTFEIGSSLFGIPFVLGTVLFGSIAAMTVCGRVQVHLAGENSRVTVGIGRLGWSRRFDWAAVTAVREANVHYRYPGSSGGGGILLDGPRPIIFGSGLNDERRLWLIAALRHLRASRAA